MELHWPRIIRRPSARWQDGVSMISVSSRKEHVKLVIEVFRLSKANLMTVNNPKKIAITSLFTRVRRVRRPWQFTNVSKPVDDSERVSCPFNINREAVDYLAEENEFVRQDGLWCPNLGSGIALKNFIPLFQLSKSGKIDPRSSPTGEVREGGERGKVLPDNSWCQQSIVQGCSGWRHWLRSWVSDLALPLIGGSERKKKNIPINLQFIQTT